MGMIGGLKIATIRGIPIRLHFTLLAMFAILVVNFGVLGLPAGILLFGSVLLHELGHSVVAQHFGIRIASIDLHLMGGVAMMTEPPRSARQELLIAAAGPAVSFLLGAMFLVVSWAFGMRFGYRIEGLIDLLPWAAFLNLAMGIFNLIPALPMDGGRIFRALLAPRLGHLNATRVAAWVSRAVAVLFVVAALAYGAWQLGLIALMLFLTVGREERAARYQEALRRGPFGVRNPFEAFGRWAPQPGPVIDVTGGVVRETREEFVDALGRRYVIVTRLVP